MTDKKISRRNFLKLASGTSLLGLGVMVSGCKQDDKIGAGGEGWVPSQYEGRGRYPAKVKGRVFIDEDNPSIVRDDEKCILCGQCIEACQNVMGVHGYYPLPFRMEPACIHCGQCTHWCPSGAITERDDTAQVEAALADKNKYVVVQTAPATKVSLGDEFGLPIGSNIDGRQVSALKKLGFDAVLDTCFSADLTIMEEASEALERVLHRPKELPHFTSCCPAWVKFCEYFYPELLYHMSSCKSPQAMFGATLKTYFAKKKKLSPSQIVSVSIMPCTAKKFEAQRKEFSHDGIRDIDYVLTTRELARLIKRHNIDFVNLPNDKPYDSLMGDSTGAGRIFGVTGGVTEAAVRTVYYLVTHQPPPNDLLNWHPVRGFKAVKTAKAEIPGYGAIDIAVCHGMKNGRDLIEEIKKNGSPWQFIEFMACPGGCIGGGGQPKMEIANGINARTQRMTGIYRADVMAPKRSSHENPEIQQLYNEFYGKPLSPLAEKLLHTHYEDKSGLLYDKEGRGV